jgi:hypothetical protein
MVPSSKVRVGCAGLDGGKRFGLALRLAMNQ